MRQIARTEIEKDILPDELLPLTKHLRFTSKNHMGEGVTGSRDEWLAQAFRTRLE